jgi:spore germination protein KB
VVIIFIVLCLALLTEMKLDNIKPLFDNGVKPIIGAALHHSGFPFMESVIFLMLACETKQGEKIGKAWFFGILTSGVMLTILTFMAISVLGPIQTNLAIYPTLELAKHIQIGRIEIIISILWFITILIRLIVIFYVTLIGLAQTFRWQGYKFFSFPLGLLVMEAMILYVPNSGYLFELYKVWGNYAFVWGVVYPVLLLVLPKRKNDNSPAA